MGLKLLFLLIAFNVGAFAQNKRSVIDEIALFKNIWKHAPARVPDNVSIDAPLMGNGDLTMSVGYKKGILRYYLSKNDFWRLRSQAEGLSGPRVVGFLNIQVEDFTDSGFTAEQQILNGITTCEMKKDDHRVIAKSWISATDNLIFVELSAIKKSIKARIDLTAPENGQAKLKRGKTKNLFWLDRAFEDSVDVTTEVTVAMKTINYHGGTIEVRPGKKLIIVLAIESRFSKTKPLEYVLGRIKKLDKNSLETQMRQHNKWWQAYWEKSSFVTIGDNVLMKAYYQGLYTMAACSRDKKFPPGLFGWTVTDAPAWDGDYHLNYNFYAPFYGLYSSNHLEQSEPQDAPLIDFMQRGKWYAENVTHTRGVLYPVGIGPLGIEVTKNDPNYINDEEQGGLFWGQRSDAAYGLVNMAQHWRCTYDVEYGKKIYPYALAVADFWEDYLRFENGRYVIYNDAIHEGSGNNKNPLLSLGLVRNAFDLIIDLSASLKIDENRQAKWKDILSKLSEFPVQVRKGKKVFRYTEEGMDWNDGNGLGIQQIYPCNAVTLDSKDELLDVSRNTIDEMQRWDDINTSNSFFVAAIRVGYDPSVIFNELHKYALHTCPNGFQLNNPHGIENSCTVANALNEMLCMSVGNVIRLFSVFPKNENASFKNIRTWGAFLVSARLTNGIVSDVTIKSEKGKVCTMINPWPRKKVQLIKNGKLINTISGDRISFKTGINETWILRSE